MHHPSAWVDSSFDSTTLRVWPISALETSASETDEEIIIKMEFWFNCMTFFKKKPGTLNDLKKLNHIHTALYYALHQQVRFQIPFDNLDSFRISCCWQVRNDRMKLPKPYWFVLFEMMPLFPTKSSPVFEECSCLYPISFSANICSSCKYLTNTVAVFSAFLASRCSCISCIWTASLNLAIGWWQCRIQNSPFHVNLTDEGENSKR